MQTTPWSKQKLSTQQTVLKTAIQNTVNRDGLMCNGRANNDRPTCDTSHATHVKNMGKVKIGKVIFD